MQRDPDKFKLVRYFLVTSFLVVIVITAIVTLVFSKIARDNLIEESKNYATSIADNLNYKLYQELTLVLLAEDSDVILRDENRQKKIDSIIKRSIHGLHIEKVKIYDSNRKIIYSTHHEIIGVSDYENSRLQLALDGHATSELIRSEEDRDIQVEKNQIGLIESYVPIKKIVEESTEAGEVIGVFEIYQSISKVHAQIYTLQYKITATSILSMGVLLLILFLIVRKADRIIDVRTSQLLEARNEIKNYSKTLEQKVADRTRKLRASTNVIIEIKNRNEQVLKNLTDGVIAVDDAGKVAIINVVAEKFADVKKKDIIGRNFQELGGGTAGQIVNILLDVLDNGIYHDKKEISIGKEQFEISASRIKNGDEITGALLVFSDITQRKLLLECVAHEIRNPLAGIKTGIQFIGKRSIKQGDDEEIYDMVLKEINRLDEVVTGFLNFARPARSIRKKMKIVEVLEKAIAIANKHFELQGITVRKEYNENLPIITIDERQMKQVFLNIFDNAIQAMPDGGDLRIGIQSYHKKVYILVSDTGVGISQSLINRIFEPFFTTRAQGTGLGLSVIKRILEEHNGEISVESEEDKGTTVTVGLPIDEES